MAGPSPNPVVGATGTSFMSRGAGQYPDPFDDMASQAMPRTMPDALRWAQSIHMIDGTYSQAMTRVASYFVTDVDVKPYSHKGDKKLSADEKQKVVDFLETRHIRDVLTYAANNLLCYGNVFVSLMVPFRRYLSCPKCGFEAPLEKIGNTPAFKFAFTDFDFHAQCQDPKCKYRGAWRHIDRRGDAESDIIVKFWNPHEMEIIDDPLRDEQGFVWKIPEYYRRYIREGALFHLCRANWEVIQAIKHGNHLLFDPGVIHHMRERPLAGIYSGGWGLSRAVINFRQAWHNQMLRRYNEAICQEFIVPFRVISPDVKAGADPSSADPVLGLNLGQFRAQMQAMIRRHKKDPGQIQISPTAIKYQMLGGEASALAPFQLIDQAVDSLLNASGVPAELYKGTLTMQAAPAALRLFESHWSHLVDALNNLTGFIVERAGKVLNWEPVDAKLKRVRTADDLNRQMALLQLMMGKQISQTTGLSSLDIDFKGEQDNLIEETEYVQDKTQEAQEDMQAKAQQQAMVPSVVQQAFAPPQGGQPQAGGAPPPGGAAPAGGAPQSSGPPGLEETVNKGKQIAQQLQQMPPTQRRSELDELRKSDDTLHSLVTSELDKLTREQNTAGGAMLRGGQDPAAAGQKQAALSPPRRFPMMAGGGVRAQLEKIPA